MSGYQPLLSLQVEHGFYAGGVCRGLVFTPSAEAARWLDRAGCVFRSTHDGFVVLAEVGRIALFLGGEPVALGFVARSRDAGFAAVTHELSGLGEAGLLFSQLPAEDDLLQGEPAPWASTAWAELLALGDRHITPAFGLLLPLPDSMPRHCLIRFGARAVPWRYCFAGAWERDGLYVADADAAVEFSALSPERLPDGREVLCTQSAAAIPLGERSARRFQLRRRAGGADKLVVKRLPVATADGWGLQPVPGGGLVSEIYVNC